MKEKLLKFRGRPLTFQRVKEYIVRPIDKVKWQLYVKYYIPYKAKKLRKQEEIRVLFVLAELGSWKTEELYIRMLSHNRFKPILGVTTSQEVPGSKAILTQYIDSRGYNYIDLDRGKNVIDAQKPDIIFYYKPYHASYPEGIYIEHNMRSLFCMINYTFNQGNTAYAFHHDLWHYSWKVFVENEAVIETASQLYGRKISNFFATGTPVQDVLRKDKSVFNNPWKNAGTKKRIIYAPHHSLKGTNGDHIEYATFLELGEVMLQLAKKYSIETQWAFKPHPTLYPKLLKIWGKEKTDAYYNEWRKMDNSQLELGEYYGLFKHSDAMIHDSCSFIIEYMYMDAPVMFLEESPRTPVQLQAGPFGYEAYRSHSHGSSALDIEKFIQAVINGSDPKRNERRSYCKMYLHSDSQQTACENIMTELLRN